MTWDETTKTIRSLEKLTRSCKSPESRMKIELLLFPSIIPEASEKISQSVLLSREVKWFVPFFPVSTRERNLADGRKGREIMTPKRRELIVLN